MLEFADDHSFGYLDDWCPKLLTKPLNQIDDRYEYCVLDTVVKRELMPEQKKIIELENKLSDLIKEHDKIKRENEKLRIELKRYKKVSRLKTIYSSNDGQTVNEELFDILPVEEYQSLKKEELKELCKIRNIRIKSNAKKDDLIQALRDNDNKKDGA
jgi:hypothetical protein